MKRPNQKLRRRMAAIAGGLLSVTAVAAGATAARAEEPSPPARDSHDSRAHADVPREILGRLKDVTPGPGFRPASAYAVKSGTQTYTCADDGTWPTSSTPKATLVRLPRGGDTIEHFGGPRWRASDGSTVLGEVKTRVPVAGQLPWLLLNVTAHEGPAGALTPVTNVSRILTNGGLPPAGSCTRGATVSPSYTAVYVFWVAAKPKS